ncbi:MAG: AAA family ATPase [Schwartzia sp.]|nr:AAA family ATPase [Schwartzia sp. (in: firmicutes)]
MNRTHENNLPKLPIPYKLTEIFIDNFKTFDDSHIYFSKDMTVFVGDNASGKSSILQALTFLKYCCTSTVDDFMKDRRMNADDLASKLFPKFQKNITFSLEFESEQKPLDSLSWMITFVVNKTDNKITLRSEKITWPSIYNVKSQMILYYDSKEGFRQNERDNKGESIPVGEYSSSLIRFIDEKQREQFPHLYAIKHFFLETEPLDLLTPKDMRRSARGQERSLGFSGEKLPNLIYKLNGNERETLLNTLTRVLPKMKSVRSVRSGSGRAGWAHLETIEQFNEHPITVQSGGISDGVLRLVALFALPFLNKSGGVILLDEVEDGINSSNIAILMEFLREYSKNNGQQIILTTHSTVLLDYAKPEEIRCLYRDINGFTQCVNFLDLKDIKEELAYLYPGEAMLNRGKDFMKGFTEER